jgi:hypothetical protein
MSATPTPPTQSDRLLPNQGLTPTKFINSPDGRFRFTLQNDGNLVLYGPYGQSQALWASGTEGNTNVFDVLMQVDGNLVVYNVDNNAIWASVTEGNEEAYLVVHNDGNVVIYDSSNQTIWQTFTVVPPVPQNVSQPDRLFSGQGLVPGNSINSAGGYKLILQTDGNFVLYGPANQVIWSSNTYNNYNIWDAILQADGNLVIRDGFGRSLWASDTSGNNNATLIVEDGGLKLVNANNHVIWAVGQLPAPSTSTGAASMTTSVGNSTTISTSISTSINTSHSSTGSNNSGGHTADIVGSVLGVTVLVLLGVIFYFWLAKKKTVKKTKFSEPPEERASANLSEQA